MTVMLIMALPKKFNSLTNTGVQSTTN
uniref:Uncharacterized protein n=1 Tax=Timema monikensis TaxID=170555 RepID=A0A7R9EL44_9NEOP|nr:unnamed protein product [Timema monikensis]